MVDARDGDRAGHDDGEAGGHNDPGWRAADGALRRLARRRAALDVEEAAALVRARELGVHVHLGLATFLEYVERVLGHAPHTARERLRVAEALAVLPLTRTAMSEGRVGWSAVRELTRVVTAATEDAWLAATAGASVRDIEDRVRGRRPGDAPDAPPSPDARQHVLRFEVSPTTLALYLAAQRALERDCGHPLTDDLVLAALCRAALAEERSPRAPAAQANGAGMASHVGPEGCDCPNAPAVVVAAASLPEASDGARAEGMSATSHVGRERPAVADGGRPAAPSPSLGVGAPVRRANLPPHQIAITTCPECARAWSDAAGRTIEISARELERASCDATLLGRVDRGAPAPVTRSIPAATRRAVLRRDRGRCVVPGCRNARHVDVHHMVWRARGGDHAPARLVTLCSAHHDAVHDLRLIIAGTAPHALRFSHADGRPYGTPLLEVPARPSVQSGARPSHAPPSPPAPASAPRSTAEEVVARAVEPRSTRGPGPVAACPPGPDEERSSSISLGARGRRADGRSPRAARREGRSPRTPASAAPALPPNVGGARRPPRLRRPPRVRRQTRARRR